MKIFGFKKKIYSQAIPEKPDWYIFSEWTWFEVLGKKLFLRREKTIELSYEESARRKFDLLFKTVKVGRTTFALEAEAQNV